jgi:mannose-1-phosphate guanylyltransferase
LLVQGSSIGENCVVGPASTVDASVLFDGASVGSGVRLLRSIVGTNTRIGADCVLVDTVVGDGAVIGTGNELCAGARVSGDVSLADRAIRFSPGD